MSRYRPKLAGIVTLLAALALVGVGIALALATPGAEAQSAPGAVNNLTLTRADGTVIATWDAPGGATKYHVTYTDNGGQSWSLAALAHTETSITITGADNSKTYVVGVRARQLPRLERLAQLAVGRAVCATDANTHTYPDAYGYSNRHAYAGAELAAAGRTPGHRRRAGHLGHGRPAVRAPD